MKYEIVNVLKKKTKNYVNGNGIMLWELLEKSYIIVGKNRNYGNLKILYVDRCMCVCNKSTLLRIKISM